MIPILDLKGQYEQIKEELEPKVIEVLRSGSYILGQNVKEFEKEMCGFLNVENSIGVANGTDSLHLSLRALGIGAGDEVITTAFTFVATTEAIGIVGATPVFVDIDPKTFNIDASKIEEKITDKTKAIMPVHLYGHPAEMDKIMDIAKKHNLYVIEDCAQAIGAEFKGQKVGSFGDFGSFSFFPTKNLGAFGDGGMVTSHSKEYIDHIAALRNHGGAIRYYHDEIGLNSRLDEVQAAILRVKFQYINEWNEKRRQNAYNYNELLKDIDEVVTPYECPDVKSVYHQYTIQVPQRDKMCDLLREKGVGVMLYYPVPLHLQKVHKHLGVGEGTLPVTEDMTTKVMSLPMFPELTQEQQKYIANAIKESLTELKISA